MSQGAVSSSYERQLFSPDSRQVLERGGIVPAWMPTTEVLDKLFRRLVNVERALGRPTQEAEAAVAKLMRFVDRGICVLGTPLLTNIAWDRPTLASCTAVPIETTDIALEQLNLAENYYRLNMGSGYNLDPFPDPVAALLKLNDHARTITAESRCERYIGNIAHISVHHPKVEEFIWAKVRNRGVVHFNISIDLSDEFMSALAMSSEYTLTNGARLNTSMVWSALANAAWECGDPGIISLTRFNAANAVAKVAPYVTTAPCAEVGLASGESCVFGYINLAACLAERDGAIGPDLELVAEVAECLTRQLDNCVELGLEGFPTATSRAVMARNRKIGIGVCGYADALLWMGTKYGSDEAARFLQVVLSTIGFRSKLASTELAAKRGRFPNFDQSRYASEPNFLMRFADASAGISGSDWSHLRKEAAKWGLRNAMTTALPPSGRSALLLGVNASIEPFLDAFALKKSAPYRARRSPGKVNAGDRAHVNWATGAANSSNALLATATEIHFTRHLKPLTVAASLVDDGVSKTINLPHRCTVGDVEEAYSLGWQSGLKAISVYRSVSEERSAEDSVQTLESV